MQTWMTRIQKRTATNAKLLVWLGCITRMVGNTLRSLFCKSKSTEEVKQPLDYEKKHYHVYDWQRWTNQKDDWN